MNTYHKIQNVFKRSKEPPKNIVWGDWYTPEIEALSELPIWSFTEKVDGTNVRVMWDGNRISFGGKTDNAQMPVRLTERLTELFGGPENEGIFEELFEAQPVCLYGEGFGSKIQSGGDYFPDSVEGHNEFALFDININGVFLERNNVEEIASNLGCNIVPLMHSKVSLTGMLQDVVADVELGEIPSSVWGGKEIEGYVGRTNPEFRDRRGNRIIVKVKYDDFRKVLNK